MGLLVVPSVEALISKMLPCSLIFSPIANFLAPRKGDFSAQLLAHAVGWSAADDAAE